MTNFDFLKNFNDELYELGVKLEEDVINSPRAVTADATLFLETLVKDIYKRSGKKLGENLISFYKKIDNLYRLGVISYIYKNKLKDAYNLRNKIHKNYKDENEEENLAFNLHQRLYYIAKKYFRDFSGNDGAISIPEYKKPVHVTIHFDNCIICGHKNESSQSNMCNMCNQKIDNVNILLSIQNSFKDSNFTKNDLIDYGFSESETISLLMELSKDNVILNKGGHYTVNDDVFKKLFEEVDQFIEIGLLLTKFYSNEITANEVKNTLEYWKGGINQKNYGEFYRLVNLKLEESFEENLLKLENIKKSMKNSSMDNLNIKEWFECRKKSFIQGDLNEAFILYNEILIKKYFDLKKKNWDDFKIKEELDISDDILKFWQNHFMSEEFLKKTNEIKKDLIIKEIKKNKSLKEVFHIVGITERELNRLYISSKKSDDNFFKEFDLHYTEKRQKTLIKHLQDNSLNKAIKITKITRDEFNSWYCAGEMEFNDFYIKTTEILMEKYLNYRRQGLNKQDILKRLNISKDMVKSWSQHKDLDLIRDFENKNEEITKNLVKRGKIINALKEDKSKLEAIYSAEFTPEEFMEIYNLSKLQKTDFYQRFDYEYMENRKRLFPKILKDNDFYNAIRLCEITQKQFNKWYIKDQNSFIDTNEATDFYIDTTRELMDKYIRARFDGKNKPDAARSVGLSNLVIDKWLKHIEFDLYWDFKKKNDKLERDLITEGFSDMKSKSEVSEIYDIPLKTIDEFLHLGKSGFVEFKKLTDLYENHVVPRLLKIFLGDIKTKAFNKALKNSKLTENELNFYYRIGKSGNSKFQWFYESYLKIKINLYVKSILSKKSHKIALKNSHLRMDEFDDNKFDIDDRILNARFEIIYNEIDKHRFSGTKLAKILGIDVDDIYGWYFKGKEGHGKYKEFALVFEIGIIMPRVVALNHALSVGIHKNQLLKKLKKDLGSNEYQIWQEHDFINKFDLKHFKIDISDDIDEEKIKNIFKNSDFVKTCFECEDGDFSEFFKKALNANVNVTAPQLSAIQREPKSGVTGK